MRCLAYNGGGRGKKGVLESILNFISDIANEGMRSESAQVLFWGMTGWVGYWFAYHGFTKPKGWAMYTAWFIYSLPYLVIRGLRNETTEVPKELLAWALLISIVMGIFWARWGRDWLSALLRMFGISNETGHERLLDDIAKAKTGDIEIELHDGTTFFGAIQPYDKEYVSSGTFDQAGNICLYVEEINGRKQAILEKHVTLTYVPEREIKLIRFINSKKEETNLANFFLYVGKSNIFWLGLYLILWFLLF